MSNSSTSKSSTSTGSSGSSGSKSSTSSGSTSTGKTGGTVSLPSGKTGTWDSKTDYSVKLAQLERDGKKDSQEYKDTEALRNAKIRDVYGGVEPPINGTSAKYSEISSKDYSGSGARGNGGATAGTRYDGEGGMSLSTGQTSLILAALAAQNDNTITPDECKDLINAIHNSAKNKEKITAQDPLTKIVTKIYHNNATEHNRDLASQIINHNYSDYDSSRVNDKGEVSYWEGGKLYWVDKSGSEWKIREDKTKKPDPGAIDLTQDQLKEIFSLRKASEELPGTASDSERNSIHDAAEAIRKSLGYTGGINGSMFTNPNKGTSSSGGKSSSGGSSGGGGTTPSPTPNPGGKTPDPTPAPGGKTAPNPTPGDQDEYWVFAQVNGSHGTVSPADKVVQPGGSLTIKMTPDAGYRVKSVIIVPFDFQDGYMSDHAAAVNHRDNSYTLRNIQNNWAVVVTFGSEASIDEIVPDAPGGVDGSNMSSSTGRAPATKSGYGVAPSISEIKTTNAVVDKVVAKNTATGNTYTMELSGGKWVLPVSDKSATGARVDYLPASTPDGNYKWIVTVYAHNADDPTDILTPVSVDFNYTIKGSMYEDDFTGDRH